MLGERPPCQQATFLPGNLRVCNQHGREARRHCWGLIFSSSRGSWLFSRNCSCCRRRYTGWAGAGQGGLTQPLLSQASPDWRAHFRAALLGNEVWEVPARKAPLPGGWKSTRGIVGRRPSFVSLKQPQIKGTLKSC